MNKPQKNQIFTCTAISYRSGRLLGSAAIMLVGFIISSAGVTINAGCIFRSIILVGRLYARGFIFG